MALSFRQFVDRADAQARALLGQSAVFAVGVLKYAEATVILAPAMEQLQYAAGGAEVTVRHTATVRVDALPRPPALGDCVSTGGERFYIVGVMRAEYAPHFVLTLAN